MLSCNFLHFLVGEDPCDKIFQLVFSNMKTVRNEILFSLSTLILILHSVFGTEFTFELTDKEEACFNEVIGTGVECTLEYQV